MGRIFRTLFIAALAVSLMLLTGCDVDVRPIGSSEGRTLVYGVFGRQGVPNGGIICTRIGAIVIDPALSPALNMVPGVATSFEGQFLMRTIPQEQVNRNTATFSRQIEGLQNKTVEQEAEIKSGIGKTGHPARFMNYGSYYSMGGAGGRRGQ
jgi:hypothetical protein